MKHKKKDVLAVFSLLNQSQVEWILLRNSHDRLPDCLPTANDIDILVEPIFLREMIQFLISKGYKRILHPCRYDGRLYGSQLPVFLKSPSGVLLDICTEISVRSLDEGQWLPLHRLIQEDLWSNLQKCEFDTIVVHMPSDMNLLLVYLVKCIYETRGFSEWHKEKIAFLFDSCCKSKELSSKLELIFFGFTGSLMESVRTGQFSGIVERYIAYSDY